MRLAHNCEISQVKEGMDEWLRDNNFGMWLQSIQCEELVTCGWLLYTHPDMDAVLLAEVITKKTGVEVALRWKMIQTDSKEYDPDAARAFHLEVAAENEYKLRRLMRKWLSRSRSNVSEYPLGVRLRWYDEFKELVSGESKAVVQAMIPVYQ